MQPEKKEYPRLVAIETTNHCNAKCYFCPNRSLARDKSHMPDSLFDDIIRQCQEFSPEAVEPFLQGEPFCDPKILDRIEIIRSRLPKTKISLYTNGYALTPEKIDHLSGFKIDHLYVSLNTLNPEKYRAVMGLDLEKTLSNLQYLADSGRGSSAARIITFRMTRTVDTTIEEEDEFIRFCNNKKVRPFIVGLFNYKGDVHSNLPIPGYPCEHITRLDILANGKVTLCCMDQDAQYSWGDVNQQSLLDIYNGVIARRFSSMHRTGRRKEIEPCGQCNVFWPSLEQMNLLKTARFAIESGVYFLRHKPVNRGRPFYSRLLPGAA